jgi:hypothetical protein
MPARAVEFDAGASGTPAVLIDNLSLEVVPGRCGHRRSDGRRQDDARQLADAVHDVDPVINDGVDIRQLTRSSLRRTLAWCFRTRGSFRARFARTLHGRTDADDEAIEIRAAQLTTSSERCPITTAPHQRRSQHQSLGQKQFPDDRPRSRRFCHSDFGRGDEQRTRAPKPHPAGDGRPDARADDVCHRTGQSTNCNADDPMMELHGQIVERGTHHDLLGREGLPRRAYQSQFAGRAGQSVLVS